MRSVRALRTVLLLTSSLPSSSFCTLSLLFAILLYLSLTSSPLFLSLSFSLSVSPFFSTVSFLFSLSSSFPPGSSVCLGFFFSLSHASFLSCSLSCSCHYLLVVICGLAFFLSIVSSSLPLPIQLSFLFFHKFVLFPSLLFLFLFLFSSCYCLFVSRVIF